MGLKFQCPDCGNLIFTENRKHGEVVYCCYCGATSPVPESAESTVPTQPKDVDGLLWQCQQCHMPSAPSHNYCMNCGTKRPRITHSGRHEPDSQLTASFSSSKGNDQSSQFVIPGEGAIDVLKALAWVGLVVSMIGGIWILATFGRIGDYSKNPIGIGVGIAVLVEGVFSCALFLVIASIAQSLIAIRRRMESNN